MRIVCCKYAGKLLFQFLKTENTAAVELLRGGNFQYYGNGQENTYPSMPTTVQNQVHVAGIITGKTELDFSFGSGEPSSQIHTTIDPEAHLTNTGLLRRISWRAPGRP